MSGKGKLTSKKARNIQGISETSPECDESSSTSMMTTNSATTTTTTASSTSSTACLPLIKVAENEKHLPRYTSILKRSLDEGIGMEDLDILQLELETLLSSTVVRSRILQEEMSSLSSAEERRDRRSKSGKGLSLLEKKVRDGGENKAVKLREMKTQSPHSAKPLKQRTIKSSNSAGNHLVPNPHELIRVEGSKTDVPVLNFPMNETLNKFWASVDPFCADIRPEDIKLLEELAKSHTDISEFKKIPALGKHYSFVWAHNDLLQEEEGSIAAGAGNHNNRDKKKSRSDVALLLAKAADGGKSNEASGSLTSRIVSALLEENVYVANNNMDKKIFRDGDPPVLRDLSIQNSMNLEMRMNKELAEQGILNPEAQKKNPEDDEILAEIKRCQQELTAISSHNVKQLERLSKLAQKESERQAMKRKISAIDNEVVENYNKLILSKQRKMPLSRKEQEKAWSVIKEREILLEQLNQMPSNYIGETLSC